MKEAQKDNAIPPSQQISSHNTNQIERKVKDNVNNYTCTKTLVTDIWLLTSIHTLRYKKTILPVFYHWDLDPVSSCYCDPSSLATASRISSMDIQVISPPSPRKSSSHAVTCITNYIVNVQDNIMEMISLYSIHR